MYNMDQISLSMYSFMRYVHFKVWQNSAIAVDNLKYFNILKKTALN